MTPRSLRAYRTAKAAGTKGQRRFTAREASLVEDQQILKKCNGCMPFLPLSPSGAMCLVTLWPLWLTWCMGRKVCFLVAVWASGGIAGFAGSEEDFISISCSGDWDWKLAGWRFRWKRVAMAAAGVCGGTRRGMSLSLGQWRCPRRSEKAERSETAPVCQLE